MNEIDWQITNARLIVSGRENRPGGCLISRGRIKSIFDLSENEPDIPTLNLHGLSLYSGLINSHDSLIASYHSYTGENRPYSNWLAWDNDLKSSRLFKERMLLEPEQLYRIGAYKNLLSGVTFVADHIPHFVREAAPSDLPVSLLSDYGIAHSVCSYSLDWGDGIEKEFARAVRLDIPFITHIAEGFDSESRGSLRRLSEKGALDEHTVLVHGLSLSASDLDMIAESGASVVWCPLSNRMLYEATAPIGEMIERDINICLGTDSSMTGSTSLFAELREARKILCETLGEEPDPAVLYEMVTSRAAHAMRQPDRGRIVEDGIADFLVLRGKYPDDPYRSFIDAEASEIYLVVRDGSPLYGDETLEPIFVRMGVTFDRITTGGVPKIIMSGMKGLLDSVHNIALRNQDFAFLQVN